MQKTGEQTVGFMHSDTDNKADSKATSDKLHCVKPQYYTPEFIAVLKRMMYMSESTWAKVIAADPTGWRAMLTDPSTPNPSLANRS